MVITAFLALLFPAHILGRVEKVKVAAEQSVWVYSHAGSPGTDEFLRIWGVDGMAVPAKAGDIEDYSFGYLRFKLPDLGGKKLTKAVLILHTVTPASFTADQSKTVPLQARGLVGKFDAGTWSFSMGETVTPTPGKDVFGNGNLVGEFNQEKTMEIDIDLLHGAGNFSAAVAKALAEPKHRLYLALTTGLAPSTVSGAPAGIYKVFSATTKAADMVPVMEIEYSD